jgi:aminoglycoside phosphotransferase (APT) family kinase protein
VPEPVRLAFERWTGARVVSARSQPGGFSPGVAARLRLDNGERVFVKAIGPKPNPDSPAFHRKEARVASALPEDVPAPRLRWSFDDGETGWVVLVFDEVHGDHPAQPWLLAELDRVVGGMQELARSLTPSPLSADAVPTASERLATQICGWRRLRDELSSEELARLDAWSRHHLDALAELEARAPAAVAGNTLLHFDVRADNVLLAPDKVWFFDWPHACVGAAWLDVLFFAPSVTMQGGPTPEEVIARHAACRSADPDKMTFAVAAIAGFFIRQSLQAPPPGLPTVRAFQAAQGVVACEWLARRTGWT